MARSASPTGGTWPVRFGTAELVRDLDKARELWNPDLETWFPRGLDDPDLALLRVTVTRAECWDSPDGAVVHLSGFGH